MVAQNQDRGSGKHSSSLEQLDRNNFGNQIDSFGRLTSAVTRIGFLALCLFTGGCAYPKRIAPTSVTKAIQLKENQTVTSGRRVVALRAGCYEPEFQADDGIFYKAPPVSMEQIKPKPWPGTIPVTSFLHGGLFIPNAEAEDKRDAIYLYYERPFFGTIIEMRPLEILRLQEKIIYEETTSPLSRSSAVN